MVIKITNLKIHINIKYHFLKIYFENYINKYHLYMKFNQYLIGQLLIHH